MRKLMPISSAAVALIIISVLSGCGGTSVEPVTGPTTRTGAAQTSSAAQTTDSAAAAAVKAAEVVAAAEAVKTAEAATVAKAKVAADAKAAAVAKAATAAKAKAAAAAKAKAAAVPPPVPATLRETCSKVEKAVSGLSGKSSPPTAPELDAALAQVKLLNGAGDTETRNALSALLEALPGYRDENPTGVADDARVAFLDSLTILANRCEAVGSSALQWVG